VAPTQAPHNFAFERSVLRGQNAPWARIDYAPAALDQTRCPAAQRGH
jgi:hypothetical protein